MIVEIKEAPIEQKSILERLMQLYLYDFSEIVGSDVNENGIFEYRYLDSYWTEPGRFPFLVYVDDKMAGFVLVNSYTCLRENRDAKSIAEFFVMRKYRRQDVGTMAAFHVFDKFPGRWEVRQVKANVAAQLFWRDVIGEYSNGQFRETTLDNELWHGPIQSFDNSHKTQSPPNDG